MGFCKIESLFAQGWLCTVILLISASWVTRITDVSHWHPATYGSLIEKLQLSEYKIRVRRKRNKNYQLTQSM
jgi:hypothetical protein